MAIAPPHGPARDHPPAPADVAGDASGGQALITPTDLALGRALADALTARQGWCHRVVETVDLRAPERGRRTSLDCTPPPDPGLAHGPAERRAADITDVTGALAVPLAMVEKTALRSFDVVGPTGQPLPLLGRSQSGGAAVHALLCLLDPTADDAQAVLDLLQVVVHADPQVARRALVELLGDEHSGGVLSQEVGPGVRDLARALADRSLLMVLLPAGAGGHRQVLKYATAGPALPAADSHGSVPQRLLQIGARTAHAFGYGCASFDIPVPAAADAASYHLEVCAPTGLQCDGLTLPPATGARLVHDTEPGSVVHAHGRYAGPTGGAQPAGAPRDAATVRLSVPVAGPRASAALVSVFTAAVFWAGQALPHGRAALDAEQDRAAGLLLAAFALATAWLGQRRWGSLADSVLLPLRVVILVCAGLLAAGATGLVVGLAPPYVDVLWWSAAAVATACAVPLVAALPAVPPGGR